MEDGANRIAASGRACGRSLKRSEEHTSELQSRLHLVCRLLLEKKKKIQNIDHLRRNLNIRLLPGLPHSLQVQFGIELFSQNLVPTLTQSECVKIRLESPIILTN